MLTNKTIFLIGMRFSGKTSLGKALAQKLQWNFVDTDVFIQEKAQCSIADMVAEHGWDYFRNEESSALQHVMAQETVVATGGGMILNVKNRKIMRKNGLVLFLSLPLEAMYERFLSDPNPDQRPPLTDAHTACAQTLQEMQQTLTERAPLYTSTAHHTLHADKPLALVLEEAYKLVIRG